MFPVGLVNHAAMHVQVVCVEPLGRVAALHSALWGAFHLLFSLSLHDTRMRASSLCGAWGRGEPQSSAAAHAPCAIPGVGL